MEIEIKMEKYYKNGKERKLKIKIKIEKKSYKLNKNFKKVTIINNI